MESAHWWGDCRGRRRPALHHVHAPARLRHGNHQSRDGSGASLRARRADVRASGHESARRHRSHPQPLSQWARGGCRAGGHGLRAALPHHGPHVLALNARIGTGLRPFQHQAGGRQLRRQGAAGGEDRVEGDRRRGGGDERSEGDVPQLVSPHVRGVGSAVRSARLAQGVHRWPAGRDVRGSPATAGLQAAAARRSAGKPAAAVADRHGRLRHDRRRGPAAIVGLWRGRRLAVPQLARRRAARRRGGRSRSGLHGHRLAAAGRGLSPAATGGQRADLRADHLPCHGPLPGADGASRPGNRLLRTGLRRAVGRSFRRHAQHRALGLRPVFAAGGGNQ